MAFDPDAYLASKQQSGGFDPDAYLAAKTGAQPAAQAQPQEMGGLRGWNARMGQTIANVGAGALRGAGSIGATIIAPLDYAGVTGMTNEERRTAMDEGLRTMGADPESMAYGGGKLAGEIAGTAGIGGAVGRGVMAGAKLAPTIAPKLAAAIKSGGLTTGAPAARALSMQGVQNAATRVGGGAIAGGAMAGAINPEDVGTGAAIGAAFPVVGKMAGESGRMLREYALNPMFKPSQAAISKLVQDAGGVEQARIAIERAKAAGKTLSGDSYTLGQAGKNAGLAATERARSAVNPENFQQVYQSQRDARLRAMQGIGQDEVAVASATDARNEAANSLYGKAFQSDAMRRDLASQQLQQRAEVTSGGIQQGFGTAKKQLAEDLATPGLRELTQRPGFAAAVNQAKTLAANKGIELQDPLQSLQGLHYIKLALDDMLNPQASSAMGRNATASIMDMRDKLAKELEIVAPMYGNARSTYAEMSAPINQMKVGQALTDKLTGESVKYGSNAKQQAEQFFRAMKNAPSIVKAETGVRQSLPKVMTKDQMAKINQVARELAKDVDLQNLGKGVGSDTAQKVARSNMMSSLADLVSTNKVARASVNLATLGAKGRVTGQLDAMLQSPEYAGKAFDELTAPQQRRLSDLLAKPEVRAALISAQSR